MFVAKMCFGMQSRIEKIEGATVKNYWDIHLRLAMMKQRDMQKASLMGTLLAIIEKTDTLMLLFMGGFHLC